MLEQLDNYDWEEAFGYAGEPGHEGFNVPEQPKFAPGTVSTDPIIREDVVEIRHISDGENDEQDWIIVGRVKDDRWFFLAAGCDCTGWDCQAGGRCYVTDSYDNLVRWALGTSERERFGITLTDPENVV